MQDFFTRTGEVLGQVIRFIVDGLSGFFGGIGDSARGFMQGLSESLGIAPTLVGLVVLVLGLWMLWKGVRALARRALIATLVWWFLGVLVLSWLIN
jgi:hypothetical protein